MDGIAERSKRFGLRSYCGFDRVGGSFDGGWELDADAWWRWREGRALFGKAGLHSPWLRYEELREADPGCDRDRSLWFRH